VRLFTGRLLLLVSLGVVCGCHLVTPFRLGGGPAADADGDGDADARTDADAEASVDADIDDDRPAAPGPLTLVATRVEVVRDRLCDLDGDGHFDNAVDDLGAAAGVAVAAFSSLLNDFIEDGRRLTIHFPHVDDVVHLTDEEAVLIFFEGIEVDEPDPEAPPGRVTLMVHGWSLDRCGEPRFYFAQAALDRGSVSARDGIVPLPGERLEITRFAQAMGSVSADGPGTSLTFCGAALIQDMGHGDPPDNIGDLNLLEAFLGGGAAVGLPTIPGVDLDLDLDGDGLERIEVDPTGRIVRCTDGDMTVIEGRDCWEAPRMQDAFSYVMRWEMTTARFGGRAEGWQADAPEPDCDGGPPDGSLFDPR